MKTKRYIVSFTVLMLMFVSASYGYTEEKLDTWETHLEMSNRCKNKADKMSAEIIYHQKMKEDYREKYIIDEEFELLGSRSKEINEHCNAIIREVKQLRDEYLVFEKWHLMRAQELKYPKDTSHIPEE